VKRQILSKLFYKIGEVAEMTGLEPYVLRYWEGEFNLKLTKSKNNQRLYQKKDIDQIHRIKALLYDEKFTIAGAKRKLRERKKGEDGQLALALPQADAESKALKEALLAVKAELETLAKLLDQPDAKA
jgi:DNA-binding transcriptional MerR regulator